MRDVSGVDCTSILRRFVSVTCINQIFAYFDISGDTGTF